MHSDAYLRSAAETIRPETRVQRAPPRGESLSLFLALPRSSSLFLSPCSPIRKKSLLREIRAERSLIVSRMYADIIEVTTLGITLLQRYAFLGDFVYGGMKFDRNDLG